MVGTIEQVLEMRRETKALEEVSDWEMAQLPRGLRIDIPLKSTVEVRRVVPHLKRFAQIMEEQAQRKDLTPVQILRNIWAANRSLRFNIEEICKTGHRHK
jgi:hypothetical protein